MSYDSIRSLFGVYLLGLSVLWTLVCLCEDSVHISVIMTSYSRQHSQENIMCAIILSISDIIMLNDEKCHIIEVNIHVLYHVCHTFHLLLLFYEHISYGLGSQSQTHFIDYSLWKYFMWIQLSNQVWRHDHTDVLYPLTIWTKLLPWKGYFSSGLTYSKALFMWYWMPLMQVIINHI